MVGREHVRSVSLRKEAIWSIRGQLGHKEAVSLVQSVTAGSDAANAALYLCHLHGYTLGEVPLDVFKVHLCCAACDMWQLQKQRDTLLNYSEY